MAHHTGQSWGGAYCKPAVYGQARSACHWCDMSWLAARLSTAQMEALLLFSPRHPACV